MKYELTNNKKEVAGVTLFQIKAVRSFGSVAKGELGGWIEGEHNLSHDGDAWVSGDAQVSGNAQVYGDAQVSGNAQVYGDAWVSGDARVYGDAWVSGDAQVYGDAWVYGDAVVSAKASFTKGRFIGGDDSGKITEIADKTGSAYWKKQYVLGDYEITPIEEEKSLVGQEVTVTVAGKTYKAVIKE